MTIGISGISIVQLKLKRKFATYRKVATSSGLNGKEIA